ncbi:MAG: restriction endonuclease [bacterium]
MATIAAQAVSCTTRPVEEISYSGSSSQRRIPDSVGRATVPPCFVFSRGAIGRDVVFRGIAVPGSESVEPRDQLVAVWRENKGQRFQNYRAVFTILDAPVVEREWLNLLAGGVGTSSLPRAWQRWRTTGRYFPLRAPKTLDIRTRDEQQPPDVGGATQLALIREYFAEDHTAFEPCAARLFQMAEPGLVDFEVTARVRDGGRDAIGRLRVGAHADGIFLDFALEAKCYAPGNSVGVREMSRLISRLRHRQFGVLVTTSFVDRQAYEEVRDDGHPVVVVAARDIVGILREHGISTPLETRAWLETNFAPSRRNHPE